METRPQSGDGPFFRGEILTAAKLNQFVGGRDSVTVFGHGHAEGDAVLIDTPERIWIRLTAKDTGSSPIRYGWTRVYREPSNATWQNTTHTGNTTYDWAVEVNNTSLTVGTSTVYKAERSITTGEWLFRDVSSGGGSVDITSGETVLLLLGTYDQYKDCPGVPPRPPTTYADACGDRTETLCVPAYAYAVYQRCGYLWHKVGDTRDFQVWANEINGGTASAFRRFYVPRWGGNIDPVTGLPDPDSECMGVAFLGYTSQGTLTCTCPSCLSDIAVSKCLAIRFRTPPRPCEYDPGNTTCGYGCWIAFANMDTYDLWDKEITIELTTGSCGASGADPTGTFDFEWQFHTGSALECDWGPDVIDPCDICAGFGRLMASISINGGNEPNCGGQGQWTGEYMAKDVCDLLCDCSIGPVKPKAVKLCAGCSDGSSAFNFILPETVDLICCEPPAVSGLEAWYRADSLITEPVAGRVSAWGDKAGSGISLTQGVPLYRAFYDDGTGSGAIANKPTVGVDMIRWIYTTSGAPTLSGANGFTVFTVFRYRESKLLPTQHLDYGAVWATSSQRASIGAYKSGSNWVARLWYRKDVADPVETLDGPVINHGDTILAIGRVSYAAGNEFAEFEINGTTYTGTAPTSGTISSANVTQWTGYNGSVNIFDATDNKRALPTDIAEIIVFEGALSDTDMAIVKSYLHGRYPGLS